MTEEQLRLAHRHCANHRAEIGRSELCGCFYCEKAFQPSSIKIWLDEGDGTALCPECAIDSVIGDASGFPAADPAFLTAMHEFWFERTVSAEEVRKAFK
jgi:hypothetical protein